MSRLIDADALMEELKTPVLMDNEKASRIWEGWHECTIAVEEAINRTPAIEERKTGKWIDHAEDGYVECPFCHSATNCDENIDELHFCFLCGAKMEGEEDGRNDTDT